MIVLPVHIHVCTPRDSSCSGQNIANTETHTKIEMKASCPLIKTEVNSVKQNDKTQFLQLTTAESPD